MKSTTSTTLRGPWLWIVRLAWLAIVVFVIAMLIIGAPGAYHHFGSEHSALRDGLQQANLPTGWLAWYLLGLRLVAILAFCVVALIIAWRKSRDWMGFFASTVCIAFGIGFSSYIYETYAYQGIISTWLIPYVTELSRALGFIFSVVCLYVFPDGQFVPRWSRWLALFWSFWMLGGVFIPVLDISSYPIGLFVGIQTAVYSMGLVMQVYRYRHISTSSQSQQTKWVIWGFAATLAGFVVSMTTRFMPFSTPIQSDLAQLLISEPFYYVPRTILAITIGMAILRYRLWNIDFIINRSLVYGAMTVLLAALFGVSLLVITRLFQSFTDGPLVAVAVSAMTFGVVFQPVRQHLKRFVDRQFYNIRVDYQKPAYPWIVVPPSEGATQIIQQTRFGAYSNLELIGRGGMAEVYKAEHPTLHRPVAIKLLSASLALESEFRKRFLREAELVSRLEHSNIVRVFDYGEEGGICYIVMEYLDGRDLGHYLQEIGRLPLAQTRMILTDIADALDYAHTAGLVHRDVKPSNVMLCQDGKEGVVVSSPALTPSFHSVLMDFGIAKVVGGQTVLTSAGGIVGTLDYIAPEQIQAVSNIDGRADVYALGVMAYQMLTGDLPFKRQNPGALLMAHLFQPPPDARDLVPDLPGSVSAALHQAMAKKPEERFVTAGKFAASF
jgi:tRNA A-37 threonylcarbamoyl transferase component Bud32